MGKPTVSIVLPVFNRLHYLRQTIDSVLAQSFQDWELIVADDGSGAETLEYLQDLQRVPRVRLLPLEHSGNVSAVRNCALRAGQGDYFAFLDSDDIWLPSKLEMQLAALRSRVDCKWSYTGFRLVDAQLEPLPGALRPFPADGWIVRDVLNARATVMGSSVVVARQLIEAVGLQDESLPWCGDFEMWARIAFNGAAAYVDEPLVLMRRHAEHSWDDLTCCRDFAEALDRIRDTMGRSDLIPVIRKRRAMARATLAMTQARNGESLSALATVLASARYAWPYGEWWRAAGCAAVRAVAPAGVVGALRRMRLRPRQQNS